jgi:cytidylate kinase
MIIAIDGPAGSGKSTVARHVARRLGFNSLDSGAIYRPVTRSDLEAGVELADGAALGAIAQSLTFEQRRRDDDNAQVIADGRDVSDAIREPRVTGASSTVAAHPEVRAAMLDKQRGLMASGNYVVEGRDIGTVVAPDAPVKAFLTADPSERARRRTAELERRGVSIEHDEVRSAIEQRDLLDSTRSAAPLRQADDAALIDTTGLTADAVADKIVALAERARAASS